MAKVYMSGKRLRDYHDEHRKSIHTIVRRLWNPFAHTSSAMRTKQDTHLDAMWRGTVNCFPQSQQGFFHFLFERVAQTAWFDMWSKTVFLLQSQFHPTYSTPPILTIWLPHQQGYTEAYPVLPTHPLFSAIPSAERTKKSRNKTTNTLRIYESKKERYYQCTNPLLHATDAKVRQGWLSEPHLFILFPPLRSAPRIVRNKFHVDSVDRS